MKHETARMHSCKRIRKIVLPDPRLPIIIALFSLHLLPEPFLPSLCLVLILAFLLTYVPYIESSTLSEKWLELQFNGNTEMLSC